MNDFRTKPGAARTLARPHYFTGRLLTARDFQADQDYHTPTRRHNVADLSADAAHLRRNVPRFALDLESGSVQFGDGTPGERPRPARRSSHGYRSGGERVIRVEYQALAAAARYCGDAASETGDLLARIISCVDELQAGGWMGRGADRFFAEMEHEVIPALRRLVTALVQTRRTLAYTHHRFEDAEEDASRVLAALDQTVKVALAHTTGAPPDARIKSSAEAEREPVRRDRQESGEAFDHADQKMDEFMRVLDSIMQAQRGLSDASLRNLQ